jgi:methionyl-tRNA formyltransferase
MLMDEGIDTGPMLSTVDTAIDPEEGAGTLGARLAETGAPLLVETLRGLEQGTVKPRSQDHTAATYAPKLLPEERTIDWTGPADSIVRRVRAFAPDPGAVTTFRQGRLKVLVARAYPMTGPMLEDAPGPGAILGAEGNPRVQGWPGLVELVEVAPAGRRRMSGEEWARGARIQRGESLG